MVSRKLDGVRTLAMENNGEIELYSRTGSLFATLDNLKPQVKKILDLAKEKYGTDFVLDGETCLVTHDGKDDFSGIMKQITRKKFTIENPSYILFDLIKKSEFDATKGETIFKDRMNMLENLQVEKITKNVKIVQHENSVSKESFQH
jgi:ATP-dependent DNA ligase